MIEGADLKRATDTACMGEAKELDIVSLYVNRLIRKADVMRMSAKHNGSPHLRGDCEEVLLIAERLQKVLRSRGVIT